MKASNVVSKLPGLTEYQEQCLLITWARNQQGAFGEAAYLFAIPNGCGVNVGTRVKMGKQGVLSGIPDLFLPIPRGKRHGLFIEMKKNDGKASIKQLEWSEILSMKGYDVVICYGHEEAIFKIVQYLSQK